jgi:hypothetical protein
LVQVARLEPVSPGLVALPVRYERQVQVEELRRDAPLVPGVPPGSAPVWLPVRVLPVRPPDEREQLGAPPVPAVAALLPPVVALPQDADSVPLQV